MLDQREKILSIDKATRRNTTNMGEEDSLKARKAMSDFSTYLKTHNIRFETDLAEGCTPRITMVFNNCEMCPGKITEGCIYFFDEYMEARVYYSELAAEMGRESENKSEVYRLMNYLQAQLWPRAMDGMGGMLYRSQCLFCPRFYITEDNMCDITATLLIPYTHYEMDVLETEDFITAALPDLLDSLSRPIFLLLVGEITVEDAISIVNSEVL
ncbi:MAG: hypothetical protein PHE26_07845 [Syntrophomonadaceae bacterium]|nr:hypothetical protein [Syntrophomonadaceae bacterium]